MNDEHPHIREGVLRDPRYPVSRIADDLLPYLRVLVEQFSPHQVILFGSYAYGNPDRHSDVDLLVVKDLTASPCREATRIRRSWRPVRATGANLGVDLLVEGPAGHEKRLADGGAYYREITSRGIRLV
ncbi:MAG: nucleotidyltransferase domain-containing protein [Armatimonadetes bacterium]|nr:nucleotidyltransferase domain-containing protein [Armatimonadota bacterium]